MNDNPSELNLDPEPTIEPSSRKRTKAQRAAAFILENKERFRSEQEPPEAKDADNEIPF